MSFEAGLKAKLERIFDFGKVTYDKVSESKEQEGIFVEIQKARIFISDGLEKGQISGKLRVFAENSKLPFGFFAKSLQAANAADTKSLYFFDFEENAGQLGNLVERSLSFVYLYDSQYDPAQGSITSVEFSIAES